MSGGFFICIDIVEKMVGFIRRNIPALSCEELISRLNYDLVMKKFSLDVASGKAPVDVRKCKSYSYYSTNETLLTDELQRRHREGEAVMWKYGKWRTRIDAYELMEIEKKQLLIGIKNTLEDTTLTQEQKDDMIIQYKTDIDYVDIQLREVRLKFM